MVEIQGEGNGRGEESEISEAKCVCACTPLSHFHFYFKDGELYKYDNTRREIREEGGGKMSDIYIYIPNPTTTIIHTWGRNSKVER